MWQHSGAYGQHIIGISGSFQQPVSLLCLLFSQVKLGLAPEPVLQGAAATAALHNAVFAHSLAQHDTNFAHTLGRHLFATCS
jgi:hypothetical protein